MQPVLILSLAWAEQEGMSDSDIASLFGIDLATTPPASPDDTCPRCGNHPVDSKIRHFVPEPSTATPERVSGRAYVRCLCGTAYYYAFLHEVDAHQPVGQSNVRAASESMPVAPPLMASRANRLALDAAISRFPYWHAAYNLYLSTGPSAAEIWAGNEAAKKDIEGPSAAS